MPSATEPVSLAFDRTRKILFSPFDIGKWFVMGFSAWLASLGEQGGGFNFPSGNSGGQGGPDFSAIADFVREHLLIIIAVAAVILALSIGFGALISWLSSRGKFMILDNVVNNRAEVKAPWKEWAAEANSFFVLRFSLQLGFGFLSLCVLAGALVLAWPAISSNRFDSTALVAILIVIGFFLSFGIAFAILMAVMKDFVVPVMYLRRIRATEALGVFRSEMLPGNFFSIVLYFLVKIGLGIGAAVVALLVTCLTCCMTAVPYIGSVILLPIFVFFECYKLHFIEQFGPQWRFFQDEPEMYAAGPDSSWSAQAGGNADDGWGSIPR